jgi:hypothetical protein
MDSNLELEVKPSTIEGAGYGLFTKIDKKKGDYICNYDGEYLSLKQYNNRYKNKNPVYVLQLYHDLFIDAKNIESFGKYVNNSKNSGVKSNCKFYINRKNDAVSIKATKNISANSEIFVPYGRSYNIPKSKRKKSSRPKLYS